MLGNMTDTQRLEHVFTVQQRIAQVARERPHEVFTSLNHYLDVEWLTRICHITDDFSRRRESTDLKAALAVPFF